MKYDYDYNDERVTIKDVLGNTLVISETDTQYYLDDVYSEDELDNMDEIVTYIEHLEVKEQLRNKGYAKALMTETISYFKKNGITNVYLNASPMGFEGLDLEDLTNFYKKYNFKVIKEYNNNNIMFLNLKD